jgi:type I restriction enzyme, S subunit
LSSRTDAGNPYGIKPKKGWSVRTLGDLAVDNGGSIQTGPFGSQLHASDYKDEGTPVVMPQQLGDNTISLDGIARISDEDRDRLCRHILQEGDIVFSRRGDVTRRAYIGFEQAGWFCGTGCMLIRVRSDACNNRFLSLFFSLPQFKEYIVQKAVGATMPNLNQGILERIPVVLPPKQTQQRIAETISAYDDLIENNRRRMELLEASVRHLYEEWFVRLRFPGHEHTKISNGLPEGWRTALLEEVAEFRLGKMLDEKKNKGEARPYLANVNVRWGQIELSELREMRFEEHELDTFGLKYGDIIMCEGGEPGRCAIWKDQMPGMMIQKAIHRIRSRSNINFVYLYHCLRHLGQSGQLATLFTGATIRHLPREKLAKVSIHVADSQLMDLFVEQVRPIEDQINLLASCNRKAADARDLLLPRLMSGEVPV